MKRSAETAKAQDAVLKYESDPRASNLKALLAPCTSKEIQAIIKLKDSFEFFDRVYGVIRRLESAACVNNNKKNPAVARAARRAKRLLPAIRKMKSRIGRQKAASMPDKAVRAYLRTSLCWAQIILTEGLSEWGY